MGRYAQRRVRGGGPPTTPSLYQINEIDRISSNDLSVCYTGPVDADDFDAGAFETNPDTYVPDTITQAGTNCVAMGFTADLTDQDQLVYFGTIPYLVTPQTVDIP